MVDQKEILEALKNGADPEALAKQITEAFNQALEEKKRLDKEAERSEAEKKARQVHKEQDFQEILDSLFDFFTEYYPEVELSDAFEKISAADMVEQLDRAAAEIVEMEAAFKKLRSNRELNKSAKSPDMSIQDFLRRNGLK